MKRYLFEYILHPGEESPGGLYWSAEDLIKHYGLGVDHASGRVKVYGEDLIHSKGSIHLYPTSDGSGHRERYELEAEMKKSRVMARLLRAGKVRLIDEPAADRGPRELNVTLDEDEFWLLPGVRGKRV